MKKLQIYVTSCNDFNQANKYISERQNSLISYDKKTQQYFLLWHHGKEQLPLSLNYGTIYFDDKFANFIIKMIIFSAKKATNITNEKSYVGKEREKYGLKSAIYSLVQKYSYIDNCNKKHQLSCNDIFDFFTDLFIRLLKNQIFINGNKRISIISLRSILHHYGYYLYWSSQDKYIYQKKYEQKLIDFVVKLENQTNESLEKFRLEIKEWIYWNTTVSLNFRIYSV